jgi:hypothetical protein
VAGGQNTCGTCHAANGALCGGAAIGTCTDTLTGTLGNLGGTQTPPVPRHEAHRCARCHGNAATSSFSTGVGCFACHVATYQRQLGTTTLTPPAVNLGIHVDGAVEVIGTTSGLYKNFALTLTYTPPSGSTPASCATNCHSIGSHTQAPAGTVTW